MLVLSLLLINLWLVTIEGQHDPCTTHEILHKSIYRGENCTLKSHKPICDALIQSTWYRIQGDAEILTYGPSLQKCATLYPIWMNGKLPSTADGIVNRTACQTGLYTDCERHFDIMVKSCSTFYVYYLHYPFSIGCSSSFCFGAGQECPPEEPCDFYYHDDLPHETKRNLGCPTYSNMEYCDTSIGKEWYKLSDGKKLTNVCPDEKTCGTEKSIWINGDFPTEIDGILDQNACIPNSTNCCGDILPIKAKNCTDFLVYQLSSTRDCTERYCIGTGEAVVCKTTEISSSTRSTTETITRSNQSKPCNGMCPEDKIILITLTVGLIFALFATSAVLLYSLKCRKRSSVGSTATSLQTLQIKY